MVEDESCNLYLTNPKGLTDLESLNSFNIYTNTQHKLWWSTLAVRDTATTTPSPSSSSSSGAAADDGDDLSVFPPSNHENLVPTEFSPEPFSPLSSPSLILFQEPEPDPVGDSGGVVPRWWAASARVICSRVGNLWSSLIFGYSSGGVGKRDWPVRKVGLVAAAAVGWWLWVRLRRWRWRRRRREERVDHLLRIIRDKDERILQLLNQIAQMNEVLVARCRTLNAN